MATLEELLDVSIATTAETRVEEFRENEDHARFTKLLDLIRAKKLAQELDDSNLPNCKFRSMFGG